MIEIDGSSGGQILRTSVALSAVKKIPCRVFNIRKSRPKPGIRTQHLLGIQAVSQLSSGRLEGDFLDSQDIKFYPGEIRKDSISVNIPTAGSITLVLQTLILPALFAERPVKISFEGGATDTFFSPTIDHFRHVFLKILEKMGAKLDVKISRRGYYPEGGAKLEVITYPAKLKGLNLTERGSFQKILAISGASESLRDKKVGERQLAGLRDILGKLKLPLEEKAEYYDTSSPGSQICLLAEFGNTIIGADNLGKLGKRAEDVGREAALELLKEERTGACLDKHLADQILPYMALSGKKSSVAVSEITSHCQTSMWVIEKFIEGKFEVKTNLITWRQK